MKKLSSDFSRDGKTKDLDSKMVGVLDGESFSARLEGLTFKLIFIPQ